MEQEGTTIRRASAADFAAVASLLDSYYSEWEVWEHDPPERVLAYIEQSPPFGYLLAEAAGVAVGCVMLRPIPSIENAGECKRLFVASQARGLRVASRLMDHLEAQAAEHHLDWIYLDSVEQFQDAISLYRKRGYQPCERFNANSQS